MNALLDLMDISVIPEYLGGTNKRTYKDDLTDEYEYLNKKKQLWINFQLFFDNLLDKLQKLIMRNIWSPSTIKMTSKKYLKLEQFIGYGRDKSIF